MQGRPLDLMYLWLAAGRLYETKEEHWACIDEIVQNESGRRDARREFETLEGSAGMLARERQR